MLLLVFWVFVLTVAVVVALMVAVVVALLASARLRRRVDELDRWSRDLDGWVQVTTRRLRELEQRVPGSAATEPIGPLPSQSKSAVGEVVGAAPPQPTDSAVESTGPGIGAGTSPASPPAVAPEPSFVAAPTFGVAAERPEPGVSAAAARTSEPSASSFDWETLVGVRLFSWIAGIALVLAALFFLRYSVERGWLAPSVRYALGLVAGLVVLGFGELWARRGYLVTGNAATAAGIGILFATDYAGYALWKIVGGGATFVLLAMVTLAAVVLSVRRASLFIALLGLLSGFATPALLATGDDRPVALFGYLLVLNAGLGWVAWRMRWALVAALSLLLTAFYQIGWAAKFLDATKLPLALGIFSVFSLAAFVGVGLAARAAAEEDDEDGDDAAFSALAGASAVVPLAFALFLSTQAAYAEHAALLLGFAACLAVGLFAVAMLRGPELLHGVGGLATTLVLWSYLQTVARVPSAPRAAPLLAAIAGFAAFYLLSPTLARRIGRPFGGLGLASPAVGALLISAIALLLLHRPEMAPFGPFGVALALAALSAAVSARAARPSFYLLAAALVIACEAIWIGRGQPAMAGAAVVVGLASLLFVAAALVAPRITVAAPPGAEGVPADTIGFALSGLFFLSMLAARARAEAASRLWLVALAVLALALVLGAWRLRRPAWALAAQALATFALAVWIGSFVPSQRLLDEASSGRPYGSPWLALALAALLWLPFVIRAARRARRGDAALEPPRSAVVSAALLLLFGRDAMRAGGLGALLGALPLAQAALLAPAAWALYREKSPADLRAARDTGRLALVAGAVVGLVAVAIPLQLDKQWITLGWAFLAAGLAGLYVRVPHPGLAVAATALGLAAFARLALNPAVFFYYPRSAPPIWNWYLSTYLMVAAALFLAARSLREARFAATPIRPAPTLAGAATILLFVLLNIEIADLFSTGERLAFGFLGGSAGLLEDLAYTIGWALFAIALLAVGITRAMRAPRFAAIALLVVTVLKAFLHDTWNLGGLYRVASLVGLAVSLALVALVLQKFVLKRGEAE